MFECAFEQYGFCSNPEDKLFSNTYIFYLWSKSQHGHVSRKFFNFNDSKAFSYKYVTYKKACIFSQKLIFLSSGKLDRSKYPQKLMLKYVNSKVEICEN